MKLCEHLDLSIVRFDRGDTAFYTYMGPFFGSRLAARELGVPIYDDPGRVWVVAVAIEGPVACGSIEIKGSKAAMKSAWVRPDRRGQGIYNCLVDQRLKLAEGAGVTVVTATSTEDSTPALLRRGFQQIGMRGKYHLLRKELTNGN